MLQFRTAQLVAPQTWRLTWLLRGQRGTEWAIRSPAPAGSRIVVLDSELPELPVLLASLGQARQLRIGPASRPLLDATFAAGTVTPVGIGLRPFAPVHLRARFEGPDIRLRWTRRDRALEADSWIGFDAPMSEAAEAWLVEILDGATVLRALSSATASALYTAAQQAADWGAPLSPGDALTFRVAQLSTLVGAGTAGVATVPVRP